MPMIASLPNEEKPGVNPVSDLIIGADRHGTEGERRTIDALGKAARIGGIGETHRAASEEEWEDFASCDLTVPAICVIDALEEAA